MHQPQATESPEAAVSREGTHGRPWEDEHGWQKSRGITKARTTPPKGLITEPSLYPNSKNRKRRRGSPDLPNPCCTRAAAVSRSPLKTSNVGFGIESVIAGSLGVATRVQHGSCSGAVDTARRYEEVGHRMSAIKEQNTVCTLQYKRT